MCVPVTFTCTWYISEMRINDHFEYNNNQHFDKQNTTDQNWYLSFLKKIFISSFRKFTNMPYYGNDNKDTCCGKTCCGETI